MAGRTEMIAGVTLLLGLHGTSAGVVEDTAPPTPFAVASVHLERNVTDGDDEVVFEVDGGDEGLTRLKVTAPDGRAVIDFTGAGPAAMGMRKIRFESPEPPEAGKVRAAYPEGVYTFTGATPSGNNLESKATLSHALPGSAKVLRPENEGEARPQDLEITWTPVKDATEQIVVVEQEELGESITTRLAGSAQRLVVPEGFLRPGKEYRLGLGTVAAGGNASYVETAFTTTGVAAGAE